MENKAILKIENAPKSSGVYRFFDKKGVVIYVGKAINLQNRLKNYLDLNQNLKTSLLVANIFDVSYIRVFSEFEALLLEAQLIKKFQPKYNLISKDGKSYLYIAITNEEFPKVFSCRKKEIINPKFLFGPFPSSSTVNKVLKFLRRIYPYCQQKNNKKPCFWSHLGLCNPCPGEIKQESNKATRLQGKKAYLKNINSIVKILSGKSKTVINNLEKEMKKESKKQNFEKAADLKRKIKELSYLTENRTSIASYLENANFYEEKQEKELDDLVKLLTKYFVIPAHAGIQSLSRIECYDISNLSGQFAVGSMVVFINGVADKSQYRRFKIKLSCHFRVYTVSESGNPDYRLRSDTAMIKEVLTRRLKHTEWSYPDLIVVDGGKGQVSAVLTATSSIPVIGLAKRLETIVIPLTKNGFWTSQNDEKYQFREINLPSDSPALNLLRRLRDETHRFAISYHRQLRKKSFI